MASVRAELVAEVLWELKRMDKLATFTVVADRAGFKAGPKGKTISTCLDAVRKDWPHLHWWRAVPDDGAIPVDSEHAQCLAGNGFEVAGSEAKPGHVCVNDLPMRLMEWESAATA